MTPILAVLVIPILIILTGGGIALWAMRRKGQHEIAEHRDDYWSARR